MYQTTQLDINQSYKINYAANVTMNDLYSSTGVKKSCVFDRIKYFHVTDILNHD